LVEEVTVLTGCVSEADESRKSSGGGRAATAEGVRGGVTSPAAPPADESVNVIVEASASDKLRPTTADFRSIGGGGELASDVAAVIASSSSS
jgi:hypothetical protein